MKQSRKCDGETVNQLECVYCIRLKKCIQHHTIFHHKCHNLIQIDDYRSNSKELYNAILVLVSITLSYWLYLNECDFYSSLSLPIIILYLVNKLDKENFSNSTLIRVILKGSKYLVENYNLVVSISFFIFLIPHLNENFLIDIICLLCIYFIIKFIKQNFFK
jgi:hypothetical protein